MWWYGKNSLKLLSWDCIFRRSGRMRGGNSRGSRGRQTRNVPSKEELDLQLDQYMASTKSHLDKELDSYMNQAQDETWDWGVYACDTCFLKLTVCKSIHYLLFMSKCASVLFPFQNWNTVCNLKMQYADGLHLLDCIFNIRFLHSGFQMFLDMFCSDSCEMFVVYISTSSSAV